MPVQRNERAERAERDCIDLHIALTEAVRRLKTLGGEYADLLVVLERTSSKP